MSDAECFVLDADTFIRSKREHYSFEICPGFWESLLHCYKLGQVGSIVPVKAELLRGKDDLADWVRNVAPEGQPF